MTDYINIVEQSGYLIKTACDEYEVNPTQFKKWLTGEVKPRPASVKKIEAIIEIMQTKKRIEKSFSRGYATQEQWEKINSMGICPERTALLSQVEFQTKTQGRVC